MHPTGLSWRLNKRMYSETAGKLKSNEFSSLFLQTRKLVSRGVSDFPKVIWIPSDEWSTGEGFWDHGYVWTICVIYLFKPISDFLKTSWICSPSLPGLDLQNVHYLLLQGNLDSWACAHVAWVKSEQSPVLLRSYRECQCSNDLYNFKIQNSQYIHRIHYSRSAVNIHFSFLFTHRLPVPPPK